MTVLSVHVASVGLGTFTASENLNAVMLGGRLRSGRMGTAHSVHFCPRPGLGVGVIEVTAG